MSPQARTLSGVLHRLRSAEYTSPRTGLRARTRALVTCKLDADYIYVLLRHPRMSFLSQSRNTPIVSTPEPPKFVGTTKEEGHGWLEKKMQDLLLHLQDKYVQESDLPLVNAALQITTMPSDTGVHEGLVMYTQVNLHVV
eukprot:2230804-Pyramimonas_sp.AAC.1